MDDCATRFQQNRMQKNTNKKNGTGKGMAAAAAGAAAIGAGAYYLLGPNKKAHQKKISAVISKMKKEVTKEAKKVKEATPLLYNKAVDMISENYAKQYKAHEGEIKMIAQKLKSEWNKRVKAGNTSGTKKSVKKTTGISTRSKARKA
jgi:uncharacterized protein HemX